MKRDIIFAAVSALLLASAASAQQPERKLVEVWREGDYIVERYIVEDNKPHKAEYEIHFAINSSTPNDKFSDNTSELKALDALFNDMKDNKMMHLKSITVTGYASPDGTTPKNEVLAKERAEHIASMIAQRYNLKESNIAISSNVEKWSATAPAIESSKLDNRGAIVRMVSSNEAPMVVDNRLKREGEAWKYLTNDILPDMRRAVDDNYSALLYLRSLATWQSRCSSVRLASRIRATLSLDTAVCSIGLMLCCSRRSSPLPTR